MQPEYLVTVFTSHPVRLWADDEESAHQEAEQRVFEQNVNHERGDLITGYKVTKI